MIFARIFAAAVTAAIMAIILATNPAHAYEELYICDYVSRSVAVPNPRPVPQAMHSVSFTVYDKDVVIQFPDMPAWRYRIRPLLGDGFAFAEQSMWNWKAKKLMLGNEYDLRTYKCTEAE